MTLSLFRTDFNQRKHREIKNHDVIEIEFTRIWQNRIEE